MMETYGVTRNQLYKDALANSPVIAPVKINNLGEVLGRITLEGMAEMGVPEEEIREAEEMIAEVNQNNPLIVVTNDTDWMGLLLSSIRALWIGLAKR